VIGWQTGWSWIDPVTSIAVSFVILFGTVGLLRDALNLLLDAVPAQIDPAAVEAYLAGLEEVAAVHDLHIWSMSTTEVAMTAHLVMHVPPSTPAFLHAVEVELNRLGIAHTTIQTELVTADCTHCG